MAGKQRNNTLQEICWWHFDHIWPKQNWCIWNLKLLGKENNTIIYLDLSIHWNTNNIDIGIYRKPTHTDVTTQFSSNHPLQQKFAAFHSHINRMLTLPVTILAKLQEWNIILTIAQNNRFPLWIIHNLKKKKWMVKKQKTPNHNNTTKQGMGRILLLQSTNMKKN